MNWLFGWLARLLGGTDSRLVVKIQAATVKACGFLPMAETVAALVAAGNPAVTTATLIAKKICVAVTAPRPAILGLSSMSGEVANPIIVDGVVIEGEFINKEKTNERI